MKHARACLAIAAALTLVACSRPVLRKTNRRTAGTSPPFPITCSVVCRRPTKADPAGRFHLHSPVGLYAGVWGSGVDFGPGDPSTEVDYQIGYGVDVTPRVNFDALLNRYTYLGASELNYNELITTTTLDETYKLTVAYTNDVWNSSTDGWYFGLGGSWGRRTSP